MSTPKNSSITLSDVGLVWPDGSEKSTLLRTIAGGLTATTGRIDTPGDVDYFQQTLTLGINATIADLPGITEKVTALHAIESGDAEHHFDVLGDNWDIEARADEALRHIGLTKADLDRRVSEVSGAETLLIALAGVRLRRAPITPLDEPTNNLDPNELRGKPPCADATGFSRPLDR